MSDPIVSVAWDGLLRYNLVILGDGVLSRAYMGLKMHLWSKTVVNISAFCGQGVIRHFLSSEGGHQRFKIDCPSSVKTIPRKLYNEKSLTDWVGAWIYIACRKCGFATLEC